MKVALVQWDIKKGNFKENAQKLCQLAEQAAKTQPDVIVLPEMWNISYALTELEHLADKDGAESFTLLSKLAKKYRIPIVGGSVATKREGQFFNTAYTADADGSLINQYDKVHLFGLMAEDQYLSAGQSDSQFIIAGHPASQVICYDIRFPEWVRKQMATGSEILFVSAQWPKERAFQWKVLLQARAIENQAFVVAVNRVGQEGSEGFGGGSLVIDPLGQILLEAGETEGVYTAEIDLEQVKKVRGQIPVFADRRTDLY